MSRSRPAAGGGRWVEVDPARLPRWLDGFHQRHGDYAAAAGDGYLSVRAADGTVAQLYPPPGALGGHSAAEFIADAQTPRRVGLVLARKSAAAIGVAYGGQLESSKVDSWYVQARTAAGGQSQQRFARRRHNQAAAAAGKATDIAVRLLLPAAEQLAAVVTGGDRRTVEAILADQRLVTLRPLVAARLLDVPTPKRVVLEQAVAQARAVWIRIHPSAS